MKFTSVLPIIMAGTAMAVASTEFDEFAPYKPEPASDQEFAAIAAPPAAVEVGKFPILGFSKAFRLLVHVTDKSKDQTPSLEGHMIVPSPRGKYKPFNPATVSFDADTDEFHTKENPLRLRGTEADAIFGRGSISSQTSRVANRGYDIPMRFDPPKDQNQTWLRNVTIGSGYQNAEYVHLTSFTRPVSEAVAIGKFMVCRFPGEGRTLKTLDTKKHSEIPATCTPVRLFPECLKTDHVRYPKAFETAPKVRCYQPGADYSLFDLLP